MFQNYCIINILRNKMLIKSWDNVLSNTICEPLLVIVLTESNLFVYAFICSFTSLINSRSFFTPFTFSRSLSTISNFLGMFDKNFSPSHLWLVIFSFWALKQTFELSKLINKVVITAQKKNLSVSIHPIPTILGKKETRNMLWTR